MDTAMVLVAVVVGLAFGVALTWLGLRVRQGELADRLSTAEQDSRAAQGRVTEAEAARSGAEARAARVPELEATLAAKDATIDGLKEAIGEVNKLRATEEATIAKERQAFQEQVDLLVRARKELSEEFARASQEALKNNADQFLQLADADLKRRQQKVEESVQEIVKPVKESLTKLDEQNQAIEKERASAYSSLQEQVKGLLEVQGKLQGETSNLVQALRRPEARGRWGEMQLQRVVEMAGMIEYCDFVQQDPIPGAGLRPDLVVRLPSSRKIVVDAKTPLDAYLSAIEATDPLEKERQLQRHGEQVRTQIRNLSSRAYWEQLGSAEFVVLFLPGEPFFSAALQYHPELIEFGVENRVILATPTTLIALLRAVAYGWRQEKLADNAQAISDLGRELYGRIATLGGHLAKVGKNIDDAAEAFNKTVGSMESMVLPQARRFRDLGAATGKDLPVLEPITTETRQLTAPELVASLPEMEALSHDGEDGQPTT